MASGVRFAYKQSQYGKRLGYQSNPSFQVVFYPNVGRRADAMVIEYNGLNGGGKFCRLILV